MRVLSTAISLAPLLTLLSSASPIASPFPSILEKRSSFSMGLCTDDTYTGLCAFHERDYDVCYNLVGEMVGQASSALLNIPSNGYCDLYKGVNCAGQFISYPTPQDTIRSANPGPAGWDFGIPHLENRGFGDSILSYICRSE